MLDEANNNEVFHEGEAKTSGWLDAEARLVVNNYEKIVFKKQKKMKLTLNPTLVDVLADQWFQDCRALARAVHFALKTPNRYFFVSHAQFV